MKRPLPCDETHGGLLRYTFTVINAVFAVASWVEAAAEDAAADAQCVIRWTLQPQSQEAGSSDDGGHGCRPWRGCRDRLRDRPQKTQLKSRK